MKKISIIVPFFNSEAFLNRCVDSILGQKQINKDDFEIILINDGSIDNSLLIAQKYAEAYSNISVYTQDNHGLSYTRNRGRSLAKGSYIWFVDSDDYIEPNSLQVIFGEIKNNPDVISIQGRMHDSNKPRVVVSSELKSGRQILKGEKFEHGAPFYIFKRSFINENELFFIEGIFHEDSEFTPRMLYLAKVANVVSIPLYVVYSNPSSITREINKEKYIKRAYDCITVAMSLYDFKRRRIHERDLFVFDKVISVMINNSLYLITKIDDKEKYREYNLFLYDNRRCLKSLQKSDFKYQIEYLLFGVFKKRYVEIYKKLRSLILPI